MKTSYNVFIVGTTSVGKTKLSIQLANQLETEIVSCDSMQLYKHADIMTAKATKQQQSKAKHHMIDLINLNELGFNRNKYYDYSKVVFDRLHKQSKSPIVVGGTNYYIESLLFDNEMSVDKSQESDVEITQQQKQQILNLKEKSLTMSNIQKYELFTKIDPTLAAKIHKNDQQRITNYLNKYFTSFKKPSLTYQLPTYKLRNPNTIVFWIRNQNRQELKTMITKRINEMLDIDGLTQIISIHLYLQHSQNNLGGVLQSIGYKQFKDLVKELNIQIPKQILQDYNKLHQSVKQKLKQIDLKNHQQVFDKCKQELIVSTSQYAKRQITWIKNRLFGSKQISNNFFILDITGNGDIHERFNNQVKGRAIEIIKKIDKQGFGSVEGGLPAGDIQKIQMYGQVKKIGEWKKFNCDLCQKQMNGRLEFDQHMRSGQHKKMVKQRNRQLSLSREIQEIRQTKY